MKMVRDEKGDLYPDCHDCPRLISDGFIGIRAEDFARFIEMLRDQTGILCHATECVYHKTGGGCFLTCIQLEKGVCRYYNPEPKDKNIDRTDLPAKSFWSFINEVLGR